MAETKRACILKIHNSSELLVLTMDGSPHCLQLHILAEDMHRYFDLDRRIKHIVIEKGKTHYITETAVRTARHLYKIQRLLNEAEAS